MLRIVFLDIDGVCNTNSTKYVKGEAHLDRTLVEKLNRLGETFPGIQFVLCSAWRKFAPLKVNNDDLKAFGFNYTLASQTGILSNPSQLEDYYYLGKKDNPTETIPLPAVREFEVYEFIRHFDKHIKERTRLDYTIAIIDDLVLEENDRAVFPEWYLDYFRRYAVRTDPNVGLTDERIDRAIRILNSGPFQLTENTTLQFYKDYEKKDRDGWQGPEDENTYTLNELELESDELSSNFLEHCIQEIWR